MKEQKRWILMETIFLVIILGLGYFLESNLSKEEPLPYADRGLPVLSLKLNDLTWEDFKSGDKETKYAGNELKIYDDNQVNEYKNVEVKGRGNSTWNQVKKPLQIKLEQADDLLGLGKTKKWVLLANYFDKSYLRSDIGFTIAEMLEEKYSYRGKFVELYVDGEYEGLYYLLKRVEILKNAVDLRSESAILVELDNLYNFNDRCFKSYEGNCLIIKDSAVGKDSEMADQIMEDFLVDFNKLEKAAKEKEYQKVEGLIDVESFAEYFLINEFTVNPDAYSSSFYFYKDGAGDKIHAGPVWDFDFSLGNKEWKWATVEGFFSPNKTMVKRQQVFSENEMLRDKSIARLFYFLMEMPEFKKEVERIFRERMSGRGEELELMIKNTFSLIKESALEDSEKWERGDLDAEIDYLLNWVRERYQYFEEVYGNSDLKEMPKVL